MDRVILKKSFSRAARSYDDFAFLQKQIGLELLNKLAPLENKINVLDIGAGTGWLIKELLKVYPKADICGVDFAEGMVSFAKDKNLNCNFIVSDALRLPFEDKHFNLVISNATYQLIRDHNQAFSEVRRVLKDNGKFCFSCFGDKTLVELRKIIKQENSLSFNYRLPTKDKILAALINSEFKNIEIRIYSKKEYFESAFNLAKWLKAIGANNLSRPEFFTKYDWNKIDKSYFAAFSDKNKIFATFEVFEVNCK